MADTVNGVPVYRDSAGVLREQGDQQRLDSLVSQMAGKADAAAVTDMAAAIPKPADASPMPERTGGAIGAVDTRYAKADHQHPRLTSTTYATLGPGGQATVTFTRSFVNKPGINLTETDATASSQPLVLRSLGWVQDAQGLYTGVTIQGSRAQLLPSLTLLSGTLSLLTQVVTGVNSLVTALTNYNIFGGNAVGATVSVIAVARSDVPAT